MPYNRKELIRQLKDALEREQILELLRQMAAITPDTTV
jgi:hypothetical protein